MEKNQLTISWRRPWEMPSVPEGRWGMGGAAYCRPARRASAARFRVCSLHACAAWALVSGVLVSGSRQLPRRMSSAIEFALCACPPIWTRRRPGMTLRVVELVGRRAKYPLNAAAMRIWAAFAFFLPLALVFIVGTVST